MLTFQEFLNKYNGQIKIGNTLENKGECVGLVSVWQDNLGIPHEYGNAMDFLNNADKKYFDIISNTPTAIPVKGDIIVWSKKYNNTFGHVGIATGTGNLNTFEAFIQNDPLNSNCHLKTYNYINVLGWLRFKPQEPMATITQKELNSIIEARNSNWDNFQTTKKENETLIKEFNKNICILGRYREDFQTIVDIIEKLRNI